MQVKFLMLFEIQVNELQFCKKYLTHQVFEHFANLMLPTRVNDAVWFDQVQLSLFIQMLTGSVQDRDTCRRWPRPWQSKFAQQSFCFIELKPLPMHWQGGNYSRKNGRVILINPPCPRGTFLLPISQQSSLTLLVKLIAKRKSDHSRSALLLTIKIALTCQFMDIMHFPRFNFGRSPPLRKCQYLNSKLKISANENVFYDVNSLLLMTHDRLAGTSVN